MTSVYVFGIILAVLVAAVLIAPLLERGEAVGTGSSPADHLEVALDALREIEFEHETGKLIDEDYRTLRARYAADAISARDAGAGSPGTPETGLCAVCDASLKPEARFCSRCGSEVAG
ncbi:MAG: zinc ribbon domain-containing protein [Gemmatimonadota bacterium]|nr:zinc ribbon domain-containing protein [Gemmatimonadota bacterium]